MTTFTPARRASTPAYYLGRPAALWLAALASRNDDRPVTPSIVRSSPDRLR